MKTILSFIIATLIVLPCLASESGNRFHFKANGYSIEPLEDVTDAPGYQTIMMFLPPSEEFSPNVNVQIHAFEGSIKEYAEISNQSIKGAGLIILNETMNENSSVWEYSGSLQDVKLHWYAKAVKRQNKIYLVTATSTESQWKSVMKKLKDCVDSFKLEDISK